MKYKISNNSTKSKTQMRRAVIKWFIYILCMVVFYSFMRSGTFNIWQPFLIIPLCVAVSLKERELPSCIFALFCGYFIDIACDFIFGFSAIWLMTVCLASSLLSRNLIRDNFINYSILVIVACVLEFSMDYLFNVLIWDIPNSNIIFNNVTIPSFISTVLCSPLIYLLIKAVYNKLGNVDLLKNYSPEEVQEDTNIKLRDRV